MTDAQIKEQQIQQGIDEAKAYFQEVPPLDQVRAWVENDINAAIYALSMIREFPEIMDKMAAAMHEFALKKQESVRADKLHKD